MLEQPGSFIREHCVTWIKAGSLMSPLTASGDGVNVHPPLMHHQLDNLIWEMVLLEFVGTDKETRLKLVAVLQQHLMEEMIVLPLSTAMNRVVEAE